MDTGRQLMDKTAEECGLLGKYKTINPQTEEGRNLLADRYVACNIEARSNLVVTGIAYDTISIEEKKGILFCNLCRFCIEIDHERVLYADTASFVADVFYGKYGIRFYVNASKEPPNPVISLFNSLRNGLRRKFEDVYID